MIDPVVFTEQMTDLQITFNVELDERQLNRYYLALNSKLNTEQFIVSCQVVFETVKRYPGSFPIVQDFVEAVEGGPADKASREWVQVLGMVRSPSSADKYKLSDVGERSLELIGGIEALWEDEPKNLVWREKDFIRAYEMMSKAKQRSLISTQLTGKNILQLNSGNDEL